MMDNDKRGAAITNGLEDYYSYGVGSELTKDIPNFQDTALTFALGKAFDAGAASVDRKAIVREAFEKVKDWTRFKSTDETRAGTQLVGKAMDAVLEGGTMMDNETREELKPCPFCGAIAVETFSCGAAEENCPRCSPLFGCGHCDVWQDTVEDWNTRAVDRKAIVREAFEEVKEYAKSIPRDGDGFLLQPFGLDWVLKKVEKSYEPSVDSEK